jgi:membrane peptidoglycan carboxypeptidase
VLPAASFRSCGKPASGAAWDLHNNGRETGARTVYQATVSSINGGFASMARRLDLCDIRDTAEAFGVHPASGGRLSDVPASIIGQASSIAPLTMTAAYAAMGDEGRYCAPVLIDGVTGPDGRPRPVPARSCRQAVDPQVAIAADVALRGVLANGTGAEDQTADGVYEVGKTGTTDNNANTWMIGTSSRVATGVWVGNVSGDQDLSRIHDFPYCPVKFTSGAEYSRHCVWRGIESAADGIYGGAASFPAPEQRFLGNGPLPG